MMLDKPTLTFDDENNGWTSFFSYRPEFMAALNGKFFTFKGGDLYLHNSKDVPRNNFYGKQFTSKISVVLNENPSTEKIFKNLIIEGNKPWDVKMQSNLTEGKLSKVEFEKRQSRWFAYTRRNEDSQDITSFSTNGIGNSTSVTASSVLFAIRVSEMICIGDRLVQIQAGISVDIGIITDINTDRNEIFVLTFDNPPSGTDYCYAVKDSRVEGGEIRGYFLQVDLENSDTDFVELFAINSNTSESYV
jgi:hypothetical protein